jgi:F-type H+-transporting ATPase subunit delta
VKGYALAGRYARALFALGAKSGDNALDALNRALAVLAEAARLNPELDALLRSPVIAAAEKRGVLGEVLAVALPAKELPKGMRRIIGNFCGLLADRGRLPLLGLIARAFSVMLDARRRIVRGSLCTAIELDEARRASIKSRLEQTVNGTLELEYQVDPAILGGVTIRLGDRILDASLCTQLDSLRDTIKKGE